MEIKINSLTTQEQHGKFASGIFAVVKVSSYDEYCLQRQENQINKEERKKNASQVNALKRW